MISALVEGLNGAGASLTANLSLTPAKQAAGRNILKASLVIQIVVILLFISLAVTFHRRCCRAGGVVHPNVTGVLRTLYISAALLTARTVFRTAEYFGVADFHLREGMEVGDLSPMLRYEWYFYVFEAGLMLVNNVLVNVRHPRKYLPKSIRTYLSEDGVTEVTGEGWVDDRAFLVTVLDPFGLAKSSSRKANGKGEVEAVV